jgi:protein-S-isoprenylcysteine O-methyltransferase Ste14
MDSKNAKTSFFGVGPKLLILSVIFSLPVIVFAWMTHPKYVVPTKYRRPFKIVGGILAAVGFVFYVLSAVTLLKAIRKSTLETKGVYGLSRHPLYGSLIIGVIPGVFLFLGMPLLLLIPLIMFVIFRFFLMKAEEEPMREIFGAEFEEYRANVNPVFPRIFSKKNRAS